MISVLAGGSWESALFGVHASHHQGCALKSGWKMSLRILEVRHLAVELPVAIAGRLGAGRATDFLDLLGFFRGSRLGRLGFGGVCSGRFLVVGHAGMMTSPALIRHSRGPSFRP